jgi:hypothetical protein
MENNNDLTKLPDGMPEKIEIIPNEAIMEIKVSGTFYQRLQHLLIYLANKKDPKEFLVYYAYLAKGGEPKEEYDFHVYTVMAMIMEIEKVAKEKSFTLEKDTLEYMNTKKKDIEDQAKNQNPSGS